MKSETKTGNEEAPLEEGGKAGEGEEVWMDGEGGRQESKQQERKRAALTGHRAGEAVRDFNSASTF